MKFKIKTPFFVNFLNNHRNFNYLLDKLLLANNEEHLFNILNEKIVWNNNDNPSLTTNKKQISMSLSDIEEACNKFYNIINQSQEKFLKNPSEYPDFLLNKKKIENIQTSQSFSNVNESQNFNENIKKEEMLIEKLEKIEVKSNNDELLCEDEVYIYIYIYHIICF